MGSAIAHGQSRTVSVAHIAPSHLIFAIAAFVIAISLSARLDYVPIWDGFEFAAAIQRAATGPFSFDELRLAGHVSHAYAVPVTIAQIVAPGQYWPILAVNVALLIVAAVGLHRLTRLVVPSDAYATDRALITAAFVLQPALLAAVVQPGLDLPLVPAFLWATVFVIEGKAPAAALAGVALVFSKETGVLLYAALIAAYIARDPRTALGLADRRAQAVRRLVILGSPVVLFLIYLGYRSIAAGGEPFVWNATEMSARSLLSRLLVPRVDGHVVTYVAIMLVLNFAWMMSVAVLAAGIRGYRRAAARGRVVRELRAWLETTPGFTALLAVLTAFALTRIATYGNARFLLGFVGLLLALGLSALVSLPVSAVARRAILIAFATLVGFSIERTIDPVSRAVFGTFRVGEHQLLRLTSISGECCGQGRDQLAYNLEFTALAAVTDFAVEAMRVGDSTLIVVPDSTNWRAIPRIEPWNSRRTPNTMGGVEPLVVEVDSAASVLGQRPAAIYLALPNGPAERGLQELSRAFTVGPERRVVQDGYAVTAYRLQPRATRPRPWAP